MSSFIRFVTPKDVRALKNRLDPTFRSLDATVARCSGLDPVMRDSWQAFSKGWRSYVNEEDSWLHCAAQMDAGESYERQVSDWQAMIGRACTLSAPQVVPQKVEAADTQRTLRTVAVAGAVIVALVSIRSLVR
jgi:hypothetical protein